VEKETLPVAKAELHTQKGKKKPCGGFPTGAKCPSAPPSIPGRYYSIVVGTHIKLVYSISYFCKIYIIGSL
jgi:hypothetical protein